MSALNQPRNALTLSTQDIYAESASQAYELGTYFDLADGRRFRYCKAGGALAAGKHTIKSASVDTHHSLTCATAAIGVTSITVTLGATNAVTLNQYAGGYIGIIAGTGLGQIYRIKSHPAAVAAATLAVTLYDPLVVALATADSKADLCRNKYDNLTQSVVEESVHVGIPLIAVTTLYYHWEQTRGIALCLAGDTAAEGTLLSADSAAGEVKTKADETKGYIGIALGQAHADGEYNFLDLHLE